MKKNEQIIYINIDDSGKLVNKEKVAIYGGLVLASKKEKDKFITQYSSIIKDIRCKYCKKDNKFCDSNDYCPELKHNMLKPKHNRQLINYIKRYTTLCCIINNDKVSHNIKNDTASRGRFLDYSLKLLIKQAVKGLIKGKRIVPNLPIKLIVNIDEQTTKTNGYYNLRDSIFEELKYGIYNFNYGFNNIPIINSKLDLELCYQKSDKSYLIQASDLVAGTIRRTYLNNLENTLEFMRRINFIDYKIFLP